MSYSKEQLDAIFAKATPIHGKDSSLYRKDSCGNVIYRRSYGLETTMGWEVDHNFPKAKGGSDNSRNLKPLQSSENARKGDTYPYKKNNLCTLYSEPVVLSDNWLSLTLLPNHFIHNSHITLNKLYHLRRYILICICRNRASIIAVGMH